MPTLFLVPTPIGNLSDITLRALEVLKSVDLILAEDTRTSGKLLKHYGIETPMQSYHMHNEHQTLNRIVAQLKSGIRMAMISDAGTPAISDPGFLLVREAIAHGVALECLPGPTALYPLWYKVAYPMIALFLKAFYRQKKEEKHV